MKATLFCLLFHLLEKDTEEPNGASYVVNDVPFSFPILSTDHLIETKSFQEPLPLGSCTNAKPFLDTELPIEGQCPLDRVPD
jgi:hypothetical protein